MDIVPFEADEGNPYAEKGEWYYERTYWAHRGVGPNNDTYVCPAKSAGLPCPICEYRAKLSRDPEADEKLVASLRPKERQLWLIHDHGDKDRGVQLWDFSHWNFGKLLDQMRKDADEDETEVTDFDDPDAGATLKVSFSEQKGGGYTFLECYNVGFKARPDGLDEEVLGHGICLDDLLRIEGYDKLKAVFLQTEEGEVDEDHDEPEEEPAKRELADDVDNAGDAWEEDEGEEEEEEEEPAKKRTKPALAKKSESDEEPADEEEEDDEPEPEEKPARKPKRAKSGPESKKGKKKAEPDEDSDWDDWDD